MQNEVAWHWRWERGGCLEYSSGSAVLLCACSVWRFHWRRFRLDKSKVIKIVRPKENDGLTVFLCRMPVLYDKRICCYISAIFLFLISCRPRLRNYHTEQDFFSSDWLFFCRSSRKFLPDSAALCWSATSISIVLSLTQDKMADSDVEIVTEVKNVWFSHHKWINDFCERKKFDF